MESNIRCHRKGQKSARCLILLVAITSPCTCAAVFSNNGADVTDQCRQNRDQSSTGANKAGVALGEECQGRTVQCFSDPCNFETCPGIPTAVCNTSPCTCAAVFSNNGADVTDQCRQNRDQSSTGANKAGVALGEECQGRTVQCFSDPCNFETCPGIPTAVCNTSPCTCAAVFSNNGADVTDQCRQNRDQSSSGANKAGVALGEECQGRTIQCFSDPCNFETCPGIPTAVCNTSPCTCAAVFISNGADVTQQCRQSRDQSGSGTSKAGVALGEECQGRVVQCFTNPCAFQTCPGIPNAVCSTSQCTCAALFSLDGADVTQQCRENLNKERAGVALEDECQGRSVQCFSDPCAYETCPGISDAVCSKAPCACEAVFRSNGADVTQRCRDNRSASRTTSVSKSGVALGEECQGRTVQCFSDSCAFATCPGVPAAECSVSPCTCEAVFMSNGEDVTPRCKLGSISKISKPNFRIKDLGLPPVTKSQDPKQADDCSTNCLFPPCLYSFCAAHPTAFCRNDYCNGCRAQYLLGGTDVTDRCQDQIPSTGRARLFGGARSRQPPQRQTRWQPQTRRFLSPWFSLFSAMFQ